MARTLTPKDCHTLINALVRQATGQASLTATDTSSFVSAGEKVLATGMENVYNALNIVLTRLLIASRPYTAKLQLIQADDSEYASRLRKVSFYSKDALPAGNFNTDLFTNFAQDFTAGENESGGTPQSTKSQWAQNLAMPLEMNFGGLSVFQDSVTLIEDAVKFAFTNEAEFAKFVDGYRSEHENDIASQMEAWNRIAILNKIASVYDMSSVMNGSAIDLVAAFNTRMGTTYTGTQLRTTYLKEFLEFFVALFKNTSNYLEERTKNFHWSVPKTVNGVQYNILRHTPKRDQRCILYGPLYKECEAMVLPEIFNDQYLNLETQFEEVSYWQSTSNRMSISVTPAVTNTSTGVQEAGTAVALDYVVGMIFDRDALMTNYRLDRADTTPLEARKHYRNTWRSFARNICSDNTENCVIFYMAS